MKSGVMVMGLGNDHLMEMCLVKVLFYQLECNHDIRVQIFIVKSFKTQVLDHLLVTNFVRSM